MKLAVVFLTAAILAGASIPKTIADRRGDRPPLWAAASEAFDAEGAIRPELFNNAQRFIVTQNVSQNPSGKCQMFLGAPPSELFRPMRSLDDLAAQSMTIVTGDVIGSDAGFLYGMPGTLYAIRVKDRVKSFGHDTRADVMYVFFPEAEIPTAHGTVCARAFAPVPVPKTGDRLLVFDYVPANDRERRILTPVSSQMIVLERDGRLYLPKSLEKETGTMDDLVWRIGGNRGVNEIPEIIIR